MSSLVSQLFASKRMAVHYSDLAATPGLSPDRRAAAHRMAQMYWRETRWVAGVLIDIGTRMVDVRELRRA